MGSIHKKYPHDALEYLEAMQPDFEGYPKVKELGELILEWEKK